MAERKKAKPKKREKYGEGEKLTKQEKAIATHLRFTCPTKTTTLSGDEVYYFTGSKAVETLLESKWGKKADKEPLFTGQQSAVNYMDLLMSKGLFWRARKLVPKRKERPITSEKDKEKDVSGAEKCDTVNDSPKLHKSPKKNRKSKEVPDEENEDGEKKNESDEKESKKKKKIKLDYHADQVFINGNDVYVWVFDPTPWTKFLIGLALVFGSIGVCLFPLWPPWLRLGIYYLSLAAMACVGALLALTLFRTVLFGLIWAATLGVHHFWLFPNLTEDCGFFDSFKPFYSYKYCPKQKDKKKDDDDDDEKQDIDAKGDVVDESNVMDLMNEENAKNSDSENEQLLADEYGAPRDQDTNSSSDWEEGAELKQHKKSEECGFEVVAADFND